MSLLRIYLYTIEEKKFKYAENKARMAAEKHFRLFKEMLYSVDRVHGIALSSRG